MHEDCALAAIEGCPYIQRERLPRRPLALEDVMIAPPGSLDGPRPPWVMAVTPDCKMVPWRAWAGAPVTLALRPARVVRKGQAAEAVP